MTGQDTSLLAFQRTIALYQEKITVAGHIGAMNYGPSNGAGKVTNSGRSCLVIPSDSDFICDVEISARRALNGPELDYFNRYYKSGHLIVLEPEDIEEDGEDYRLRDHFESFDEESRTSVQELDYSVRHKLGSRILDIKLDLLNLYRSPVDVSAKYNGMRRKPTYKQQWSHLY